MFTSSIILTRNLKKCTSKLVKYSTSVAIPSKQWNGIVKDAEKVVGYPTSFLSLRWLLNDEVSNIAFHLTKLIGTEHPIIRIARDLLQQNALPKWGLIVLLVSKAAGIITKVAEIDRDSTSGILHSQRVLAEIVEMLQTGHTLHNGIMNISSKEQNRQNLSDLNFGNKIALLSGDYLYSKCFQELALLKNNKLNRIISTSLMDLAQSEFMSAYPEQRPNQLDISISKLDPGPYKFEKYLGNPREEWILRTLLNSANLLAKSCRGTLILGGHNDFLQEQGYIFGRSLALAYQANLDLKPFISDRKLPFKFTSAPILFQLDAQPELYELFHKENRIQEIREIVEGGCGVGETKKLLVKFVDEALDSLEYFPESDAKDGLVKIVQALELS